MKLLMSNKVLKFVLATVLILNYIPEGNSKEIFHLDINEGGARFNESIEINDEEKTVVYKVPSHNEINKTDVLVDYKNGHFVTKIPKNKACYIKSFPTADEQSLGQTRQNLKLVQIIKSKTSAKISLETVKTIMEKIREISREELSPKILDFCGKNTAYFVKEHVVPKRKGKSFIKRRSMELPETETFRLSIRPSDNEGDIKKALPNGYLTCKTAKEHLDALSSCRKKGINPRVGCGLYPITCRYKTYCDLLGPEEEKTYAENIGERDEIVYLHVSVKCVYQHLFTEEWCCDVVPC